MTSNYAIVGPDRHRAGIDIAKLATVLRRRRAQFLSSIAIALGLAVAYLVFTPPTYTSKSVLYINPNTHDVVNGTAVACPPRALTVSASSRSESTAAVASRVPA